MTQKNISNVSGILNSDVRYTSDEIAGTTGSLETSTHTILRKTLDLHVKLLDTIPHILANEQNAARVKMVKIYKIVRLI